MSIRFTTLLGIVACALASSSAFAQPAPYRGAVVVAENGMSSDNARDKTMIQKQTNPRENGDQSERKQRRLQQEWAAAAISGETE